MRMIEKLNEKFDDNYDEIEASGVFKDIESSIVQKLNSERLEKD